MFNPHRNTGQMLEAHRCCGGDKDIQLMYQPWIPALPKMFVVEWVGAVERVFVMMVVEM